MNNKTSIDPAEFQRIFEAGTAPYLVLCPDDDFIIVAVNDAYLRATKRERAALLGAKLFDAFPDNPEDANATGAANLGASLRRVLHTGEMDTMPVQRYDIPIPTAERGGFEERYWSPTNTPVLNADGTVRYIVHRVEDITQFVRLTRAREREQNQKANLEAKNEEIMAELISRGDLLNSANERLRIEADRKNEFLAMLAHELRSPLAAVANVTHLLQPVVADNDEAQNHVGILQRQIRSLKSLVDSLLDVSRITRGLVELKQEQVSLASVVRHAVETVQPLIREKQHTIAVTTADEPTCVKGDELRLEQVLVNLLTNAARYTQAQGHIDVSLKVVEDHIDLRVRDNGIGLEPQMVHQVFDVFAQGKRGLARSEGGLGIGLTVVKQLVKLHGGSVTAHSSGPGRGAEFVVCLPRAESKPAAAVEANTADPQERSLRVLVVEDNFDTADTMAAIVEHWGHQVAVAYDGQSGLETAQTFRPDLVLLDIGLPKLDGYQVAQKMREHPQLQSASLAALTGYGTADDRKRVLAAGFNAHFIKPVDLAALQAFISSGGKHSSAGQDTH